MLARLGVCAVLGFVLVLECILATWLIFDGPLGAVEIGIESPRLNVARTAALLAIAITASALHLRRRSDGHS